MKSPVNKELIQRYLANQCTVEEGQLVRQWIADPANAREVEEAMHAHWFSLPDEAATDRSLVHLFKKMEHEIEGAKGFETVHLDSPPRMPAYLSIAAGLLVFALLSAAIYLLNQSSGLVREQQWEEVAHQAEPDGVIAPVTLPDGSKVWLNAASKIRYARSFEGSLREVYLEGEAFFDVAEDEHKPFLVHTTDFTIKVLGTAFNVKSYADDPMSETILMRGKVLIQKNTADKVSEMEMKPNDRVVYSRETHDLRVSKVAADDYALWRQGTLRFENETVEEVIRMLERWYAVKFVLPEDQDMQCLLTARIEQETLEEMLELLKSGAGIQYTINNDEVTIEGTLCE